MEKHVHSARKLRVGIKYSRAYLSSTKHQPKHTIMSEREKNTPPENLDAPSILPIPEGQEDSFPEKDLPEENRGVQNASDARDPSEVPPESGVKKPTIPASDEQEVRAREVMEGVDRADDDQRREARMPSNQPPPADRE